MHKQNYYNNSMTLKFNHNSILPQTISIHLNNNNMEINHHHHNFKISKTNFNNTNKMEMFKDWKKPNRDVIFNFSNKNTKI